MSSTSNECMTYNQLTYKLSRNFFQFSFVFTDFGLTCVLKTIIPSLTFVWIRILEFNFRTQVLKYLFSYSQTCFHKGGTIYIIMEVNFFHRFLSCLKVFSSEWEKLFAKELLFLFLSHFTNGCNSALQWLGFFTCAKYRFLLIPSHVWIEKDEEGGIKQSLF